MLIFYGMSQGVADDPAALLCLLTFVVLDFREPGLADIEDEVQMVFSDVTQMICH